MGPGRLRLLLRCEISVSARTLVAVVGGVALAGMAYLFFLRRSGPSSAVEGDSGYVDSAACGACHSEIVKTYRLTGMGRSLYRPRPENTVEDYQVRNTFYHRRSERYYTMLQRSGKFYQRRHQIGFRGQKTNIVEDEVDFVIGSGNHARTYLHRTAEGKLVELPVSWYAENDGYWAMSPGYDRPDHQDFRRAIPYDCMFCHNAYPMPHDGSNVRGSEPIFGDRIPEGIDCQRCHGPGRVHIAAAGSGRAAPDSIRRAILNPARLSRDRQLELCMQCHLETTSRRLPNAIRRYDRGPFSYRPGDPLGDHVLYFDHAPEKGYDDKFEVAHAAYRLRKSACFQASQMTCTTCHSPHQAQRGEQAIQRYVAVCHGCHLSAHAPRVPAAANCLDCHMPKRRTDDVVHVVMTDHYIQRRKPIRDLLTPLQETNEAPRNVYRGEVALYYPALPTPTPESELYLGVAQVQHGANLEAGTLSLQQAIEEYKPEKPEFYFELGRAYSQAGRNEEAVRWYDEALRRGKDFRRAVKELASTLSATGRLTRAVEVLEKAAASPPRDAGILTDLGNLYLEQGKLDQADQVLRQALDVNPDLPEAHNLLGLLQLKKGDRVAAEMSFRNAICIQPDLAIGHNNLANLLAGAGDSAQAAYHFEKAIASNPGYVEAHHSYGLILVLMRQYDKALAELQEAMRLDPNLAQAHSDLADVLAVRGRVESAVDEYRRAIQLKPESAEAYYRLGSVLAEQGKSAEGEQQFRLAVQRNPDYHEAHLALGLILARKGRMGEARVHFQKATESPDPSVRQAALRALR